MFDFPFARSTGDDDDDDFEPSPDENPFGGPTRDQRRIQKALGNRENKDDVWWFMVPRRPDLDPHVSFKRLLLTIGERMGRWGLWNWPSSYTRSPTIKPTKTGYFQRLGRFGTSGDYGGMTYWGFIIPNDMNVRQLDELTELCIGLGYTPWCDKHPALYESPFAFYQKLL